MHATWRKAAGIRRFAGPIFLPLRLSCALQTQCCYLTKNRLLHSALRLGGGLVKPASPLNTLANRRFKRAHWTH